MKNYFKTFMFGAVSYLLNYVILAAFFLISEYYGIKAAIFSVLTLTGYAFLYTLPSAIIAGAAFFAASKANAKLRSNIVHWSYVVSAFITALFLLFDFGLYRGWGFHINPLVCNLLTTPGGFASMGLRTEHVVPLVLVLLMIAAVFGAIGYGCAKINVENKLFSKVFSLKTSIIAILIAQGRKIVGYD